MKMKINHTTIKQGNKNPDIKTVMKTSHEECTIILNATVKLCKPAVNKCSANDRT